MKKEDLVSLSKKKVPEKNREQRRKSVTSSRKRSKISEKRQSILMWQNLRERRATGRRQVQAGLSGSGEGGVGIVDPLMQKYHMDVMGKDKRALAYAWSASRKTWRR